MAFRIEGRHFGLATLIFIGIAATVALVFAINSVSEEDENEINNKPRLLSKKSVDGYNFRKIYEPEFNRVCYAYYEGFNCFVINDSIKQYINKTYEIEKR